MRSCSASIGVPAAIRPITGTATLGDLVDRLGMAAEIRPDAPGPSHCRHCSIDGLPRAAPSEAGDSDSGRRVTSKARARDAACAG